MTLPRVLAAITWSLFLVVPAATAAEPIRHAILAIGGETFITDPDGRETWTYRMCPVK